MKTQLSNIKEAIGTKKKPRDSDEPRLLALSG
jgi:hypothetical protein